MNAAPTPAVSTLSRRRRGRANSTYKEERGQPNVQCRTRAIGVRWVRGASRGAGLRTGHGPYYGSRGTLSLVVVQFDVSPSTQQEIDIANLTLDAVQHREDAAAL